MIIGLLAAQSASAEMRRMPDPAENLCSGSLFNEVRFIQKVAKDENDLDSRDLENATDLCKLDSPANREFVSRLRTLADRFAEFWKLPKVNLAKAPIRILILRSPNGPMISGYEEGTLTIGAFSDSSRPEISEWVLFHELGHWLQQEGSMHLPSGSKWAANLKFLEEGLGDLTAEALSPNPSQGIRGIRPNFMRLRPSNSKLTLRDSPLDLVRRPRNLALLRLCKAARDTSLREKSICAREVRLDREETQGYTVEKDWEANEYSAAVVLRGFLNSLNLATGLRTELLLRDLLTEKRGIPQFSETFRCDDSNGTSRNIEVLGQKMSDLLRGLRNSIAERRPDLVQNYDRVEEQWGWKEYLARTEDSSSARAHRLGEALSSIGGSQQDPSRCQLRTTNEALIQANQTLSKDLNSAQTGK